MSRPLTPLSPSRLNARSPNSDEDFRSLAAVMTTSAGTKSPSKQLIDIFEDEIDYDELPQLPSSPFQTQIDEVANQENSASNTQPSPTTKGSPSKVSISISEQQRPVQVIETQNDEKDSPRQDAEDSSCNTRKPDAVRFPQKASPVKQSESLPSDDTLRFNEGSTTAVKLIATATPKAQRQASNDSDTITLYQPDDETGIDDSCFTTFSEAPMPDMATFGHQQDSMRIPRSKALTTPSSRRAFRRNSPSPSPAPRNKSYQSENTTYLLDFTTQFENGPHRLSPGKVTATPSLRSHYDNARSPTKNPYSTPSRQNNLLNLLDFDLPPAPTPRSVPSISIRELETVKSTFASEISTLRANLSGKDAQIAHLQTALNDAERRVGQATEEVREERGRREAAEQEKNEWLKRGKEFEERLGRVREEVQRGEKEKEGLRNEVEEARLQIRDLHSRLSRAETSNSAAQAAVAVASNASSDGTDTAALVKQQLDANNKLWENRLQDLTADLHRKYKEKHETKVATLKKSYEARAQKHNRELVSRVDQLTRENEELALSFASPMRTRDGGAAARGKDEERLERLEEEIRALESEKGRMGAELAKERKEKGELVAAVDEMLALQTDASIVANRNLDGHHAHHHHHPPDPRRSGRGAEIVEDFKRSIANGGGGSNNNNNHLAPPSNLLPSPHPNGVAPTTLTLGLGLGRQTGLPRGLGMSAAQSRIGKFGAVNVNGGAKSRMMKDIERMGGGGGVKGANSFD